MGLLFSYHTLESPQETYGDEDILRDPRGLAAAVVLLPLDVDHIEVVDVRFGPQLHGLLVDALKKASWLLYLAGSAVLRPLQDVTHEVEGRSFHECSRVPLNPTSGLERVAGGGDPEDGDTSLASKKGRALAHLVLSGNVHEHPLVSEHRVDLLLWDLQDERGLPPCHLRRQVAEADIKISVLSGEGDLTQEVGFRESTPNLTLQVKDTGLLRVPLLGDARARGRRIVPLRATLCRLQLLFVDTIQGGRRRALRDILHFDVPADLVVAGSLVVRARLVGLIAQAHGTPSVALRGGGALIVLTAWSKSQPKPR